MSPHRPLRRGWTTGTCATAAAKAAFAGLVTGEFPDPVEVTLPRGERVAFALACSHLGSFCATAGVVKDAGDDPDVTHGATILATVRPGVPGTGITFRAGVGVGTVTRPGLPVAPGEPAINPVPRRMMTQAIREVAALAGGSNDISSDVEVEIAVPGGEALAARTLNARLGIVGGLSILGTTGIVVPYSCAAWIHTIRSGIDVARAAGIQHIAGATGATSESAVRALYGLPEVALIDMGDFVGGMLKYLRRHPVPRVTVAGGMAKMTKLAQGLLDLHSRRGTADLRALARLAAAPANAPASGAPFAGFPYAAPVADLSENALPADLGERALYERIVGSNTVAEAFAHAAENGVDLGNRVARCACETARRVLEGSPIAVDVAVFDRNGALLGRSGLPAQN